MSETEEAPVDRSTIEKSVKKVISEILRIDEVEITPNANFIFDLGADSMHSIQLVAAFEEEFDIEMNEEEAFSVQTVAAAVDLIQNTLVNRS